MPTPKIYGFPIQRPNFLTNASWSGEPGDPQLSLDLFFVGDDGTNQSITLLTKNHENAILCLPSTATVDDLTEDVIIAHVRMCGMISGTVPGSIEYQDALTDTGLGNARYFQMPCGDVKVIAVSPVNDQLVNITVQKGSQTPRTVQTDFNDLARYTFAPSTQLLVLAGAIRKEFPTYIQDPASNKYLTQNQMDTIKTYVLTQTPWI